MRKNTKKSNPSINRRKYGPTVLTVSAWAIGAGMNPQTMEKMFRKQGIEIVPRKLYGIREFLIAVTGDKHAAEVRNLELDAKRKEREEAEKSGKLIPWELVEREHAKFTAELIQDHDSIPEEAREWLEKVYKPIILRKLEPPKVNGEK